MQSSLYVGLSAQIALRRQLDAMANNVANANTTGFRADEIRFEQMVSATGDKNVSFASTGDTYVQRRSGSMVKSDNPLDVAISGEGWMALQTPTGTVYTRDGRMTMAENGLLQSINGHAILDAGNAPIETQSHGWPGLHFARRHADAKRHSGRRARSVFHRPAGQTDPGRQFQRYSRSSRGSDHRLPIQQLHAGFTENSNVNPVMEMSRLVMIQRSFEEMTNTMESSESSFTDAIKTLGSSV